MLLLVALATSALALDDSSLRADDTSDLFRDPYDLILRPGQLGWSRAGSCTGCCPSPLARATWAPVLSGRSARR